MSSSKYNNAKSIKKWDEKERPREKLVHLGKEHLSNAELLGILIGSGSRDLSAVDLCQHILEFVNNDLNVLGKLSVTDLCKFKGIGPAKAITIISALEIGRRRQSENAQDLEKISSSRDVYNIFLSLLADLPKEEFWVLYLNKGNKIIGKEKISSGGISSTVVDVKIIVKSAIDRLATSLILVHNHPSGALKPSKSDIDITNKIQKAAELLDLSTLDHVIISNQGFFSFADEGFI